MEIEIYIPVGKSRAISRGDLAGIVGLNDRETRREIQHARERGALIMNDQDGKGYYRIGPDDLDTAERQYWQDTARAMAILKRRKALHAILKEAGRI